MFIVILVSLLLITYQSIKNPERPPSLFGYQPFTVLSNSMDPYFNTGDMVIIKETSPANVSKGDVITFTDKTGKYITHRVIEIKNRNSHPVFVTKGDNNNVKDGEMVTGDHIVGKQTILIPGAGYLVEFVSGPIGFILLILLPLAGYIFLELFERAKKGKKRDKTREQLQNE
ncbi:signal peptidase I [Virgibacillus phasianinus]|nr:signal peptidase I [Virgibacillus phasianinus]